MSTDSVVNETVVASRRSLISSSSRTNITTARSEYAHSPAGVLKEAEDDVDGNILTIRVQAHSSHCEAQILQIIYSLVPEMVLSPEAMAAAAAASAASASNNNNNNNKKKNDLCLKVSSSSWLPTSTRMSPQKTKNKRQQDEDALVPKTQQAKQQQDLAAMVNIRPLTGGLSNSLFIVSSAATTGDDSAVLVRIHPDNDEQGSLVNRHVENELVAWLSTCYININTTIEAQQQQHHVSLAPHLYGRFWNGRVEEFYPRRVPIADCRDLVRVYGCSVARWLAELHRLQVPERLRQLLLQQQQPYTTAGSNKEGMSTSSWWQRGNNWLVLAQRVVDAASSSCATAAVVAAAASHGSHQTSSSFLFRVQTLLDTVQHEWAWLQQAMQHRQEQLLLVLLSSSSSSSAAAASKSQDGIACNSSSSSSSSSNDNTKIAQARACQFASQIVLNHGDVQSLNVLVSTTDKNDIRLIDYEYASLSPRALDMANMWLECTDMNHIRANYEDDFPSAADQIKFLKAYLQQYNSNVLKQEEEEEDTVYVVDDDDDEDFVEALRWEVGRYTVVLHLQWAIWGLEQWHRSDVSDYDYIGYTEQRLRGYYHHKDLFWGERTS